MARLLLGWLLFSGIGSFIVIGAPSLVTIGFFMLIIPGLLMSLLPTAFLYSATFAAFWFPLHGMIGEWRAVAVAAVLTYALLWAIPQPFNAVGATAYREVDEPDLLPDTPIEVRGEVLVRYEASRRHLGGRQDPQRAGRIDEDPGYLCRPLCQALLFTPGVTGVSVIETISGKEARFVLRPRGACATSVGLSRGDGLDESLMLSMAAAMDEKELCIERVEALVETPDVTIVSQDMMVGEAAGRWSLANGRLEHKRLELYAGDRLALRVSKTKVQQTKVPLMVGFTGAMENAHFAWARQTLGDRNIYQGIAQSSLLDEHTTIRLSVSREAARDDARGAIAAFLADPTRGKGDPALDMVNAWLGSFANWRAAPGAGKPSVDAADAALIEALIEDRRVTNFTALVYPIEKMDDVTMLREAAIERLAELPADPKARGEMHHLEHVIKAQPAGAYAELSATERAVVENAERRLNAPALIERQADRGAAAVPLLVGILRSELEWRRRTLAGERLSGAAAYERGKVVKYHDLSINAAQRALCRLGPEAAGAREAVEAMIADGLFTERMLEDREVQLMRVRIGTPVEDIAKPSNIMGTTEDFHARLKRRAANFRAERDC
ncbi:hypothetical protein [Sphingomicrobium arenosum]|uniref:hypothetical protein n=1 Tax=Sphingomicrobium arenosum TaxID=2233861 RepID=UPI002240EE39|nr:hypothetical protein [Sphingomicrobium arenosum]